MKCPNCKKPKTKEDFLYHVDGRKRYKDCRICVHKRRVGNKHINELKRKNHRVHKEEINAKRRTDYDPKKKKDQHLKYLYGISLEDYNDLFQKQSGRCAICKSHQSKLKRALVVDHNHDTGEIRGLLCDKCNLTLGQFNDRSNVLRCAANYLEGRPR